MHRVCDLVLQGETLTTGEPATEREVLDRLVRIETKLDTAISRGDDHEDRLRRLERALWVATGAAAAGGGVIGAIVKQALGGG